MAIDTQDKIAAALSGGQRKDITKVSATSEGAGTWHSLFKIGSIPPAGNNPGSLAGTIPTSTTVGGFVFSNPVSGNTHLMQMALSGGTVGKVILYDRLWHNSTMSGIVTGTNSLGSPPALTRPDNTGADTELWAEFYTAIGATGATLSVVYTNQAGTGSRTATYVHPANAESVGQMVPLTLQAGDTGVRSVQSYGWSVSTGTAGDFGLVILRRIAEFPLQVANVGNVLDYALLGMPRIYDNACLCLMVLCTATNTGLIQGSLVLGQG